MSYSVGGEPASLIISTQIAVDEGKVDTSSKSDGKAVAIEFKFPTIPVVSSCYALEYSSMASLTPALPHLMHEIYLSRMIYFRNWLYSVCFGTLEMTLTGTFANSLCVQW